MNLQISFGFLMTSYFTTVKTATGMLLLESLYFCLDGNDELSNPNA